MRCLGLEDCINISIRTSSRTQRLTYTDSCSSSTLMELTRAIYVLPALVSALFLILNGG